MTLSKMTIDYLANHPAFADELAQFAWKEWQLYYEQRRQTFSDTVSNYRARANTDRLPLALIALDDGRLLGTVSLKPQDLEIRPEMTPWLASLFVIPQFRRRGVASRLVERVGSGGEARFEFLLTHSAWGNPRLHHSFSLGGIGGSALPEARLASHRAHEVLRQTNRDYGYRLSH